MRGMPIRAGFIFPMQLIFGGPVFSTKMGASYNWPSVVMAIKLHKCDHFETKSFMISARNLKLIEEVFNNCHNVDNHEAFEKGYSVKCECKTELNLNIKFEVENFLTVEEISDKFNIIFEEAYKIQRRIICSIYLKV